MLVGVLEWWRAGACGGGVAAASACEVCGAAVGGCSILFADTEADASDKGAAANVNELGVAAAGASGTSVAACTALVLGVVVIPFLQLKSSVLFRLRTFQNACIPSAVTGLKFMASGDCGSVGAGDGCGAVNAGDGSGLAAG